MSVYNVILVDSNAHRCTVCRETIEQDEDISLLFETDDPGTLLSSLDSYSPNIVLIEYSLLEEAPGLVDAVVEICPYTRVLGVSHGETDEQLMGVLSAGCRGFIDQKDISSLLNRAIRKVTEGEAWVPRRMVSLILDRLGWLHHPKAQSGAGAA